MSSDYRDDSTWRGATAGGIPYRIVDLQGEFTEEGASLSETIIVDEDKLLAFITESFPPQVESGPLVTYPTPRQYLGFSSLATHRIRFKPHVDGLPIDPFNIDPNAPAGTYQGRVELTIDYEPWKNKEDESDPNDPQTFLEITCDASGEFFHSVNPAAKWELDNGNQENNEDPDAPTTITVPELEWNANWPRVPRNFMTATLAAKLRSTIGKINSSSMSIFYGAPAETILFVGYSLRQQYNWRDDSQPPVQLDLKFLEKHVDDNGTVKGHNHFWRPGKGWQKLLYDGTNPVFQSSDLNNIFVLT